jgi:hypothetical protein
MKPLRLVKKERTESLSAYSVHSIDAGFSVAAGQKTQV